MNPLFLFGSVALWLCENQKVREPNDTRASRFLKGNFTSARLATLVVRQTLSFPASTRLRSPFWLDGRTIAWRPASSAAVLQARSDQCLAPLNDFLGDPKVRRLIRDEIDKLRKLERQPIAA